MRQDSDQLVEQIIAEALSRELESVPPPPEDQMWQQISLCLSRASFQSERHPVSWRKVAFLVAAVLVLTAGVGLYRSFGLTFFERWDAAGSKQVEGAGNFLITSDECEKKSNQSVPYGNRELACSEDAGFEPPAILSWHYRLEKAVYPERVAADWQGGLYNGPGGKLLWLCKEPPAENLSQLLSEAESLFKVTCGVLTTGEGGLTVKNNEGNLGLVVRDNVCDRLLLVKEGQFTELELREILADQGDGFSGSGW